MLSKAIIFLSFCGLGFLLVASVLMPDSPAIWWASTAGGYEVIRAILMLLLFELLVTKPPRNILLREVEGFAAAVISTWALRATYQNQMQLLDTASLLLASICMGLTVLESSPEKRKAYQLLIKLLPRVFYVQFKNQLLKKARANMRRAKRAAAHA